MENYICDICGKRHKIYNEISMPDPDLLQNMTEAERKKRVVILQDHFFIIDKEMILLKAQLEIPVQASEIFMEWVIWVITSKEEFLNRKDDDHSRESTFFGRIYSEIPFYSSQDQEEVLITYKLGTKQVNIPKITFLSECSEVSVDQRRGLPFSKVVNWMNSLHH